ncbi:MAG: phytanoyl-CoA dioxygenase family protein [Cyanobacteria bacterium P01_A01_bin.40]
MSNLIQPDMIHEKLQQNGFVKLGRLFYPEQVAVLQAQIEMLLDRQQLAKKWKYFRPFQRSKNWTALLLREPGKNTNLYDFPGESAEIDQIIDNLLGRLEIKSILNQILGDGYRIRYAQIRRAEVGAPSGAFHQDIPGEVGLTILLSEIKSNHGTTAFLPGSHRWPRLLSNFRLLKTSHLQQFLSGATGSPGEGYLFYNRTWHGVSQASEVPGTAIILTFLAKSQQTNHRIPESKILSRMPQNLKQALLGHSHFETDSQFLRAKHKPDKFVCEQIKFSYFSPWRIPMFLAFCYDNLVITYRKLLNR